MVGQIEIGERSAWRPRLLSTELGSRYKSFRGVTLVKADVATLGSRSMPERGCACSSTATKPSGLPGPQAPLTRGPLDPVLQVTTEETPDGGMSRHLQAAPDYILPVQGRIRVPVLPGSWRMLPGVRSSPKSPTRCAANPAATCHRGWRTGSWWMRRSNR